MTTGLAILIPLVGIVAACVALGVSRASYYRSRVPAKARSPRPRPRRALGDEERTQVLATLDSDRFADKAPQQVYAALLDENRYFCSVRTMYRILAAAGQVQERRNQRRHPTYVKPQLEARGPNQVWSWDITKVAGPVRGVYYCLYVVLDIFSRFVVGWAVAPSESADVGQFVIDDARRRHRIVPGQLTVHSDRGAPMTAKSTAMLFVDLGIVQSHSRPHVSDDNPFSEAAFKTFLYRPNMPERFGSVEDARAFFTALFHWYNEQHYHSGIALLTPGDVHRQTAPAIIAKRQAVLEAAHRAHPERFVRGTPTHPTPPPVVWINPPTTAVPLVASASSSSSDQRGPQREAARSHEISNEPARARTAPRGRGARSRPPPAARAELPPTMASEGGLQ